MSLILLSGLMMLQQTALNPNPHDATSYPVVLEVPDMAKVKVSKDIHFKSVEGVHLKIDVYYVEGLRDSPLILLMNGNGDEEAKPKIRNSVQQTSWARLLASQGFIAITFDARGGKVQEDMRDVLSFVEQQAHKYSGDSTRIGLWAAGVNARMGMLLASRSAASLDCAAIYYGQRLDRNVKIRTDLPTLFVQAGNPSASDNIVFEEIARRAVVEGAPLRTIHLPNSPVEFDTLDNSQESLRAIKETIHFFNLCLRWQQGAAPLSAHQRALANWRLNRWAEAAEAYSEFSKWGKVDDLARVRHAICLFNTGDARGLAMLRSFLDDQSLPISCHLEIAPALDAGGKGLDAERLLAEAVGKGDRDARLMLQLGALHAKFGRLDEAILVTERAVKLRPQAFGFFDLACLYGRTLDSENALMNLESAIKLGFHDYHLMGSSADLAFLRKLKRFQDMLSSIRR